MKNNQTYKTKLLFLCVFFMMNFHFIGHISAQDSSVNEEKLKDQTDSLLRKKRIYNYLLFSGGLSIGWNSGVSSTTCIANGNHQAGIGIGFQVTNIVSPEAGPADSISISLKHINVSISNKYFFKQPGRGAYFEILGGINLPISGNYKTTTGRIKEGVLPVSYFKNSACFGLSFGTRITKLGESAFIAEVQYRYNPLPVITYESFGIHQAGIGIGVSF